MWDQTVESKTQSRRDQQSKSLIVGERDPEEKGLKQSRNGVRIARLSSEDDDLR